MKLKVYISLPITGKDLERQKKYAQDIAERVAICGHDPMNPFYNLLPDDAPRTAHMKGSDQWYHLYKGYEKIGNIHDNPSLLGGGLKCFTL